MQRLFEQEIPEIADGVIEIRAMAREPGYRSKVAVASSDARVDCVGACVGVLRFYANGRRDRLPRTIAWSMLGSAIGFCAGFAWKTRELTASMGRSSLKQMGAVRDQHWLERHPIDYA